MKHVIQTTDVLSYEQFGFTNCVRFGDVLYLSGISALDPQGQVLGSDIETQTIHTYRNIERGSASRRIGIGSDTADDELRSRSGAQRSSLCCGTSENLDQSYLYQRRDRGLRLDDARAAAGGSMLCRGH